MTERIERCENCRWWAQWGPSKTTLGDCRIESPIVVSIKPMARGKWPRTFATDFCGEFAPKPPEAIE